MKPIFSGVIPPVPTLFNQAGQFDSQAQAALIDRILLTPVDGLFFWAVRVNLLT